jgi:LysM repeat protein
VAAGATPGDQPPRFLAGRSRSGAGLAGSAADRLASGESLPAAASLAAGDPDREPTPNEAGDGFEQDFARAADAERRANPPARSWRGQRVSQTRRSRPPVDPSTPSWEEPRRFEAYPTLKTRMNLPNLPRAGVMAIALVVAAIGLFFLPTLLGVGNNPQTGGGQPSASVAGQSSASIAPTPQPVATPLVYVIQSGDTLEKIRRKFKVTMDALLEANPQIKNPNKIKIGDEITIPTPGASQAPAGSASTAP